MTMDLVILENSPLYHFHILHLRKFAFSGTWNAVKP